jgi:hypothetical protein
MDLLLFSGEGENAQKFNYLILEYITFLTRCIFICFIYFQCLSIKTGVSSSCSSRVVQHASKALLRDRVQFVKI